MSDWYAFYKLPLEEQKELLGVDIGDESMMIIVELDEYSKRRFYNEQFAPLVIRYIKCYDKEMFQVLLYSIDDSSLNMKFEISKMTMLPHEAQQMIEDYLKRTNYFISLVGFEYYCKIFGNAEIDYN